MTLAELMQLFGDLNQLITALQETAGTHQNDLPTIRIDE
jgi:hypothetical protein